jgi:hypothetical protein
MNSSASFSVARRKVLQGVGAAAALHALTLRNAYAQAAGVRNEPIPSPYGALTPVVDLSTGLSLL